MSELKSGGLDPSKFEFADVPTWIYVIIGVLLAYLIFRIIEKKIEKKKEKEEIKNLQ